MTCISIEDIQSEVDYWKSSIVGFVISANPPRPVMEGFFRRIWKERWVDKPWHMNMELNKDDIQCNPIWVQLDLHFKYRGHKCLERIVKLAGPLIKVDSMTANRYKLNCAWCMIEVKIDQPFTNVAQFLNDRCEIINVKVTYEWKTETFAKCKKLGHDSTQFYVKEEITKKNML
ncbi:Triosephosphate isomerase [Bienertia sinuspersici]